MAPSVYFDASFGGIPLLIANLSSDSGRDIAIQSPARGDDHGLQDRGRRLLTTDATLLFIEQAGQDPYLIRFDRVRALALSGEPQIFSHPILGSYRARIGTFVFRASADELSIEVNAQILAETEPQLVFPTTGGVSGEAGLEAVTAAAAAATTKLGDVGLTSGAPVACTTAVESWSTAGEDLDAQDVLAQLGSLLAQIATDIEDLELATDIARWEAFRALIALDYQLRRAGEAFTASVSRVFDLVITRPEPMRAICARVYGAALAEDRAQQVTRLNRIRTPGRVPAGTRLKMPSDGARP